MNLRNCSKIIFSVALWALTGSAAIADRGDTGTSKSVSGTYTRGIGIYPGRQAEYSAPRLVADSSGYRNIALHRPAYASSAYDYNLTAQLLTDGIANGRQPSYLSVITPQGELPRREREWLFDDGPYSRASFDGPTVDIDISLHNYSIHPDRISITGSVVYNRGNASGGYDVTCETATGTGRWRPVYTQHFDSLPGEEMRWRRPHSDPNKQAADIRAVSMRRFNLDIPLTLHDPRSRFRIVITMPGADKWNITACDFFTGKMPIDIKPSGHFTSAWMSAGKGEEWVYVDLGTTPHEFDCVKIISPTRKMPRAQLQVSDDAKSWSDVATTGSKDEIKLIRPSDARYVRLLLSPQKELHTISEIQIMGRGGAVPAPQLRKKPTDGRIDLAGGDWRLQRASLTADDGAVISSPGFAPEGWIAATVPATVLSSFRNIEAIPDPNYADNQLQISESYFNSDFWYRTTFELPGSFTDDRLFLNFDGINWKAEVYVNGRKAGRIDGAFKRGVFDITPLVHSGENVLAVKIIHNAHPGAVKEKNAQSTDFNGGVLGADNPTFHASVGWDWIPTIRGRNAGIWNDVYLSTSGPVTVSDPLITTSLPLPDTTSARLSAEVLLTNHSPAKVSGTLEGRIGDITFSREVELPATTDTMICFNADEFPRLHMTDPRLWWPNGYGEPYLYDASFRFTTGGKVSDSCDFKAGIRQITADETGDVLSLYINGRRFIARGGNWGFSESNLNYRRREYDVAVAYHADMNMNMIRNWVGMTGDEEFYDACDRNGILVWQDFWLANPSDGPDPYDNDMFIANADDYVRRIRRHPSIGIYCGRNEGFPPAELDSALRSIVRTSHPDLHYIPSSADRVVTGHGPYRMLPAKDYFTLKSGNDKLHTERGMPNVLTYESFLRTFSPDSLWPQGNQWGLHDYTREGAQGASSFNEIIARGYGEPGDARQFSELAQWVNYDGHRSMFESRSINRRGLLMWMSHPCWPSMVWQTYDYYFEPTAGYFGIKKAAEPLHIQWNPASDSIEVVNYNAGIRNGLKATAAIHDLNGRLRWTRSAIVDSREDTTVKCFPLEIPDDISDVYFIKLTLADDRHILSDNFYHSSTTENDYTALSSLPEVELKADISTALIAPSQWESSVVVENPSDVPALMIRINAVGADDGIQILPMFYSDNYFSLLPGEKKTVTLRWKEEDTRGNSMIPIIKGYNAQTRFQR